MLLDSNQTVIFQQFAHAFQFGIDDIETDQIVHHPHQQNPVIGAFRAFRNGVEGKASIVGCRAAGDLGDIFAEFCRAGFDTGMRFGCSETGIRAEIQAVELALFIDIFAENTRNPFTAGGIFANDMIGMQAEKIEGFSRVAIFIALGIFRP